MSSNANNDHMEKLLFFLGVACSASYFAQPQQRGCPKEVRKSQKRGLMGDAKARWELKLLRDEIKRQDKLSHWDHDSDCACWSCIGKLQASVVQAYLRRMQCL